MNDLISRKKTIEMLRAYAEGKFNNGEIELANGILKAVNYIKNDNIPTAYDADKVVEQLEEQIHSNISSCPNAEESNLILHDRNFGIRQAIEIEKGGGWNNEN